MSRVCIPVKGFILLLVALQRQAIIFLIFSKLKIDGIRAAFPIIKNESPNAWFRVDARNIVPSNKSANSAYRTTA